MTRMVIWSAVGVALLAAVVIALALAPKVAVLFIVAVGILALVLRLALWIGRRGSADGESDATGDDLERGEAMQTFQHDKARHTGPGPWGS
jgi:membrane protein implicated in regulation of membrane protease activity